MTEEQKNARRKSAESGRIKWIMDNCLRKENDDYVFISYKSDDYERVLEDIVYRVCVKYGMKVYFDEAFGEDINLWVDQYYRNMCSPHCKAVIAFVDNAYCSSYATLLEVMTSWTKEAGTNGESNSLEFLPIHLELPTVVEEYSDTCLGKKTGKGNVERPYAAKELKKFNEIFQEVATEKEGMENFYSVVEEARLGSELPCLTVKDCHGLMNLFLDNSNVNVSSSKELAEVIYDKLTCREVFDETNIERVALNKFKEKYNGTSFTQKCSSRIWLVGSGDYTKYTTDECSSAKDLVWGLIKKELDNQATVEQYIRNVINTQSSDDQYKLFISVEDYEKDGVNQNAYQKLDGEKLDGEKLESYYIHKASSPYEWIEKVLKKHLAAKGLPEENFTLCLHNEN